MEETVIRPYRVKRYWGDCIEFFRVQLPPSSYGPGSDLKSSSIKMAQELAITRRIPAKWGFISWDRRTTTAIVIRTSKWQDTDKEDTE